MEKSLKDKNLRGCFNSAQALADFSEIILYMKQKLSAHHSPVIVFGGSYGGMLAAWFRLKYPHVTQGAMASSAPLLQHVKSPYTYFDLLSKDFQDTSKSCFTTIKQSWVEFDRIASRPDHLQLLSHLYKTCSPLKSRKDLEAFVVSILKEAAQYDGPPFFPVATICGGIDHGAPVAAGVLEKLAAGLHTLNFTCLPIPVAPKTAEADYDVPIETQLGLSWQYCSELVYFNTAIRGGKDSMFPEMPFDMKAITKRCTNTYGVPPRPQWLETYYGGQDVKLILKRFGSNIIFSNGLRDPYSGTGVLENLSDTLVAVVAPKGSHALDLLNSAKTDPKWLVDMRHKEAKIIEEWLALYYSDLSTYLKG